MAEKQSVVRLRVYGGAAVRDGKSVRLIVAARSQLEGARIVGWSTYSFARYWSETGNEEERRWALANPRMLLVHPGW